MLDKFNMIGIAVQFRQRLPNKVEWTFVGEDKKGNILVPEVKIRINALPKETEHIVIQTQKYSEKEAKKMMESMSLVRNGYLYFWVADELYETWECDGLNLETSSIKSSDSIFMLNCTFSFFDVYHKIN